MRDALSEQITRSASFASLPMRSTRQSFRSLHLHSSLASPVTANIGLRMLGIPRTHT